jgi:hypothetical protein
MDFRKILALKEYTNLSRAQSKAKEAQVLRKRARRVSINLSTLAETKFDFWNFFHSVLKQKAPSIDW